MNRTLQGRSSHQIRIRVQLLYAIFGYTNEGNRTSCGLNAIDTIELRRVNACRLRSTFKRARILTRSRLRERALLMIRDTHTRETNIAMHRGCTLNARIEVIRDTYAN